jgi:hypothetical protein
MSVAPHRVHTPGMPAGVVTAAYEG